MYHSLCLPLRPKTITISFFLYLDGVDDGGNDDSDDDDDFGKYDDFHDGDEADFGNKQRKAQIHFVHSQPGTQFQFTLPRLLLSSKRNFPKHRTSPKRRKYKI